jgi:hypothetical protein
MTSPTRGDRFDDLRVRKERDDLQLLLRAMLAQPGLDLSAEGSQVS